ncbi:hypothetical protein H4R23_004978, partial [Coemansia sp. Cherry 401B]
RLNGSLTIGQMLGEGRSGTMHQGKYNGRPAALKISFADAAPEIFEEMRNEVAVYEQLADLQGTDIPQLYDWGLADIDGFQCAVIVLEELTDVLSGISEECKAEYLSMAERDGSGIFGDSMLAELNQSRSRFDPIDFYLRVGTILYQRGF